MPWLKNGYITLPSTNPQVQHNESDDHSSFFAIQSERVTTIHMADECHI